MPSWGPDLVNKLISVSISIEDEYHYVIHFNKLKKENCAVIIKLSRRINDLTCNEVLHLKCQHF